MLKVLAHRNVAIVFFLISFLLNLSLFICDVVEKLDELQDVKRDESKENAANTYEKKLTKMLSMDMEEIRKRMDILFGKIDSDNSKSLSLSEVTAWCHLVKEKANERDALLELRSLDVDSDGKVSLNEMIKSHFDSTVDSGHAEDLKKRFDAVDKDSDSYLNVTEITRWLNPQNDLSLIKLEINEILDNYDKNKDGVIGLDEFLNIGQSKEELAESDKERMIEEFNSYDLDSDGRISISEITKVVTSPAINEMEESIEKIMNNSTEITRDTWNKRLQTLIISQLTDNGELLRFPNDYKLGLGYQNVAAERDEDPQLEDEDNDSDDLNEKDEL